MSVTSGGCTEPGRLHIDFGLGGQRALCHLVTSYTGKGLVESFSCSFPHTHAEL
jgi:hypothetical protein